MAQCRVQNLCNGISGESVCPICKLQQVKFGDKEGPDDAIHHYRCQGYLGLVIEAGSPGVLWDRKTSQNNQRCFKAGREHLLGQGGIEVVGEYHDQLICTYFQHTSRYVIRSHCLSAVSGPHSSPQVMLREYQWCQFSSGGGCSAPTCQLCRRLRMH